MSTVYFLTMLKEAAALRDACHPYNTGFNRMSMDLKNEEDDLVLYVSFPNKDSTARLTDKGEEDGDMGSLFVKIREHIRIRQGFSPSNS